MGYPDKSIVIRLISIEIMSFLTGDQQPVNYTFSLIAMQISHADTPILNKLSISIKSQEISDYKIDAESEKASTFTWSTR